MARLINLQEAITVKELIAKLQELDGDMLIAIDEDDGSGVYNSLHTVETEEVQLSKWDWEKRRWIDEKQPTKVVVFN